MEKTSLPIKYKNNKRDVLFNNNNLLRNVGDQMKEIKHGIYKNIDIEEYHKSQGISSSGINLILKSPAKFYYQYLSGLAKKEDTKATLYGSAIHLLALEPELFNKKYIVLPEGLDRRTKEGKALYESALLHAELNNQKLLKCEDFKEISSISYAIRKNKVFIKLIESGGCIEDSLYWQDPNGSLLRARPDFYNDFIVVDIKTTESAAEEDFQRSIFNYNYHIQAAMQLDGLEALDGKKRTFCHLVVEKEQPHLTACYMLDQTAIDIGRAKYKEGSFLYKQCLELDDWPGYPETIQTISLPDWYLRKVA
ncbi:MAG TPA: PD-(D/E)XK nuclease-like domain-containing protein [Candidatus Babeliales bacterium]|jgi:exodeoxyribonuclease VIII|nr:PD-(D/E)XK nuclease-like domain-containing protein [Candidatus Babeliales bacterium]